MTRTPSNGDPTPLRAASGARSRRVMTLLIATAVVTMLTWIGLAPASNLLSRSAPAQESAQDSAEEEPPEDSPLSELEELEGADESIAPQPLNEVVGGTNTSAPLRLVSQSSSVEPNGEFTAEFGIGDGLDDQPNLVLRAHLHERVADRAEFAASIDGELGEELTQVPLTIAGPLASLRIPLTTNEAADQRVLLTEGGVYPLRIELVQLATVTLEAVDPERAEVDSSETDSADGEGAEVEGAEVDSAEVNSGETDDEGAEAEPEGEVLAELITHLVRVPETQPGNRPLLVTLVVDLHEPLILDDLTPVTITSDRQRTTELVGALAEYPRVIATVRPTPQIVDRLINAGGDPDRVLLDDLRLATQNREVLASPYVRIDTGAWLNAGLEDDLVERLTLGTDTLAEALGVRPDRRILIHDGRIPANLLAELRTLGVDALVVDEVHLDTLDDEAYPLTMLQKFQLAEPERGTSVAVAADSALSSHLRSEDQVLGAQHALSDMAVLALEAPTIERAAVVKPQGDELFTGDALRTLLAGIAANPLLRPATLDRVFDRASLARESSTDAEGDILQRRLRSDPVSSIGEFPDALEAANSQLEAYREMVGPESVRPTPWEQMIRLSAASELEPADRETLLRRVNNEIRSQTRGIEVPESQSVTLTNRSGAIPIRVRNSLGYAVQVRIEVESDKLGIAESDRARVVTLEEGTNAISLDVEARSSGDSRLNVNVTSPDGHLALGDGRYTIRSTSVSGFGIALSVGAGLVLVAWWFRHHRDRRRDRRLVRAAEESSATV